MLLAESSLNEYGVAAAVATPLIGLLIWFVKHTVTVTIPKLIEAHANTVTTVTATHATTIDRMVAQAAVEQREERETCERRHEENKQLHIEVVSALKELRHGQRDLHQSVTAHHAVMDHIAGITRQVAKPS